MNISIYTVCTLQKHVFIRTIAEISSLYIASILVSISINSWYVQVGMYVQV